MRRRRHPRPGQPWRGLRCLRREHRNRRPLHEHDHWPNPQHQRGLALSRRAPKQQALALVQIAVPVWATLVVGLPAHVPAIAPVPATERGPSGGRDGETLDRRQRRVWSWTHNSAEADSAPAAPACSSTAPAAHSLFSVMLRRRARRSRTDRGRGGLAHPSCSRVSSCHDSFLFYQPTVPQCRA